MLRVYIHEDAKTYFASRSTYTPNNCCLSYCRQYRDKQISSSSNKNNNKNSTQPGDRNNDALVARNNNNNNVKNSLGGGKSRGDVFVRRTESMATSEPKSGSPQTTADSVAVARQKPSSMGELFRSTGQLLLHPRRQIKQSIFCRKMSQRNISLPFLQTLV